MLFDLQNVELDRPAGTGFRLVIENLQVAAGERLAVTGPSGCGKSTTLDLLGMTLRPTAVERFRFSPDAASSAGKDAGSVDVASLWRARDLDAMADIRRRWLGYVLQTGELLPFLSVFENIQLTARLAGKSMRQAQSTAERLAEKLEIKPLFPKMPSQISIGERQRAAIARALASSPKVILADEPTASLDPAHARSAMQLLLDAVEEEKATLILVSHDLALVEEFGLEQIQVTVRSDAGGRATARLSRTAPRAEAGADENHAPAFALQP